MLYLKREMMKAIYLVSEDIRLQERIRDTLEYYDLKEKYTGDYQPDATTLQLSNEKSRRDGVAPLITIKVVVDFPLENRSRDTVDLLIVDNKADREDCIVRSIRASTIWEELPVILITYHRPAHEYRCGYSYNYDMYLPRKFKAFELREFVRRLLTCVPSTTEIQRT